MSDEGMVCVDAGSVIALIERLAGVELAIELVVASPTTRYFQKRAIRGVREARDGLCADLGCTSDRTSAESSESDSAA
jgi:hypothetical protein